jgi:hypothetical protein
MRQKGLTEASEALQRKSDGKWSIEITVMGGSFLTYRHRRLVKCGSNRVHKDQIVWNFIKCQLTSFLSVNWDTDVVSADTSQTTGNLRSGVSRDCMLTK